MKLTEYTSTKIMVDEQLLFSTIDSLKVAIEYVKLEQNAQKEILSKSYKDEIWMKTIESDIRDMEKNLKSLRQVVNPEF